MCKDGDCDDEVEGGGAAAEHIEQHTRNDGKITWGTHTVPRNLGGEGGGQGRGEGGQEREKESRE